MTNIQFEHGRNLLSIIPADRFNQLFRQHFQKEYQDFVSFVIKELNVDYDDRIVEIGCRTGWVSLEIARRMPDAQIIGLDSDERFIRIAQQNQEKEKIDNVQFIVGGADYFNESKPQAFDALISFKIFHLLKDHQQLLRNLKRIIKKNGKYAITDYRSDLKRIARAAIWFNGKTMPGDFQQWWKNVINSSYTLEEMVQLLLKTDIKDWKVRSSLFDFLVHNARD